MLGYWAHEEIKIYTLYLPERCFIIQFFYFNLESETFNKHRILKIFSRDFSRFCKHYIFQDTVLEVWHSKDNYGTMVGRRGVRKDPAPSWRNLAWSEDAQLLAVGFSDGAIELCDTLGTDFLEIKLFHI